MKKLVEITEAFKIEDLIQEFSAKHKLTLVENQIYYQLVKKGNSYKVIHIWKLFGKENNILNRLSNKLSYKLYFFVQNPITKNYMFHFEYVNQFQILRNKLVLATQEELNNLK